MHTLILYDSRYGNTEQIARTIAGTLHSFGQTQIAHVDRTNPHSLEQVDLLILGSPTQGFRPSPALQLFLGSASPQELREPAIACFDTRFRGFFWKRSAAPWMVRFLRRQGITTLVPPESFFVKAMKQEGPLEAGELERAADWARRLSQQYEKQREYLVIR